MRGRPLSFHIELTPEERARLKRWQRSPSQPAGLVRRGLAILLLDEGLHLKDVVARCHMTERNVRKWARRFVENRVDGLSDLPRPGRKPVFSP